MQTTHGKRSGSRQPTEPETGARPIVKWTVIAVLVVCVALLAWRPWQSANKPEVANTAATSAETNQDNQPGNDFLKPKPAERQAVVPATAEPATARTTTSSPPAAVALSAPAGPVDPAIGTLVADLRRLSGTNAALTAESVAAWKTNFAQLVQSGAAAIPALQAFLAQNVDSAFSKEAWQALGYSSARIAALDALRQIGGPEATALMETMLGSATSPREIAVLARNLEEGSPGQYREQALAAARTALRNAASSQNPQLDVAPLFEVFQHYGDASAVAELENATGKWNYYATIALANLPEGAGIPSLLRMADPASGSGNRLVALEMVAQLAVSSPEARAALLNQARTSQIAPNLWPYLTSPLAGDQFFAVDSAITPYPTLQTLSDLRTTSIRSGNQNFYALPGAQNLSPEVIAQRVALVDELLKITPDPSAQQALTQARNLLTRRYTRAASQQQTGP